MTHPVLTSGKVAVVTGAAMGIGLAACKKLAGCGLKVAMADLPSDDLDNAAAAVRVLAADPADILVVPTDVGYEAAIYALRDQVLADFGAVDFLMNNAVSRFSGDILADISDWRRALDINLWGVINGVHAFLPGMMDKVSPSVIVNVGSKQGITNPPGNVIYNLSKAALNSFTESLQHQLRSQENNNITAHLLVPGWTTTGNRDHNPGAWLPEQVVERLMTGVENNDFYIVCPDNEVTAEMDRKRILWGAGDITENRPPLSRWQGDYDAAFAAWDPDKPV